jgi:predicted nucleic acid-binding protein
VVAIDTRVLVRVLVGDQPAQAKAAEKLFASADVFIPDTVLLATEWGSRAAYELGPADVCVASGRSAACLTSRSPRTSHDAGLSY